MFFLLPDTSVSSWTFEQERRRGGYRQPNSKYKLKRRETFHSQQRAASLVPSGTTLRSRFEVAEIIKAPQSNLSVPRIITQKNSSLYGSTNKYLQQPTIEIDNDGSGKSFLAVHTPSAASFHPLASYEDKNVSATLGSNNGNSNNALSISTNTRRGTGGRFGRFARTEMSSWSSQVESRPNTESTELDVQSVINERRPSKLKSASQTQRTAGTGSNDGAGVDERPQDTSIQFARLYKDEDDETQVDETTRTSQVTQVLVSCSESSKAHENHPNDVRISLEYDDPADAVEESITSCQLEDEALEALLAPEKLSTTFNPSGDTT